MFQFLLAVFLFLPSVIFPNEKEYIVLNCRQSAGMFSIFNDVLSLCKHFEKGLYNGIEVNFFNEGLYYSHSHGYNWWQYYCEPIQLGKKINVVHIKGDCPGSPPFDIEMHTTRQEAYDLISQFIRIKDDILRDVQEFINKNFWGHYIISVHYRGTDKIEEATPVSYETVMMAVKGKLSSIPLCPFKVFIATDEQQFIDYMIEHFGDAICCIKDAIRATDGVPLHFSDCDRYQQGRDALLDCLLLSQGDYLIRMSSNLSLWSTFFNPSIPVLELNQRYGNE